MSGHSVFHNKASGEKVSPEPKLLEFYDPLSNAGKTKSTTLDHSASYPEEEKVLFHSALASLSRLKAGVLKKHLRCLQLSERQSSSQDCVIGTLSHYKVLFIAILLFFSYLNPGSSKLNYIHTSLFSVFIFKTKFYYIRLG